MDPKTFFLQPKLSSQKQYEALRAFYVDRLSSDEAAKRFSFSTTYFKKLRFEFNQSLKKEKNPFSSSKSITKEESDNNCSNSLELSSLRASVLQLIDKSSIPLSPAEIASKLERNPSSVRGVCRELVKTGIIVQPYSGYYCSKSTHRVLVPLRCHNIALRCSVGEDVEHWENVEVVGGVKVGVCFGAYRRRITGFVACDSGMSLDACLLALNRWFDVAEKRLGHPLGEVELRTVEFNRDYVGVRLDGSLRCWTRRGLLGVIERIYQRRDCVRHEWKISKPMGLTEFEALLDETDPLLFGKSSHKAQKRNIRVLRQIKIFLELGLAERLAGKISQTKVCGEITIGLRIP